MAIDIYKIKEELVVFLRNQSILTLAQRGGLLSDVQSGTGNDIITDYVLNSSGVKNVKSVKIGGVAQTYGVDYEVDYDTQTISFTTAPETGNNNLLFSFDYGSTDRIYPDFPRGNLAISDFPRISIELLSSNTTEQTLGLNYATTELMFEVTVFGKKTEDVDNWISAIRSAFISNKKNFYHVAFIYPQATGPMIVTPNMNDKIVHRTLTLIAPLNQEVAS